MKPYYQDNAVTIYHGDCREILPNGILKAEWDIEYPDWIESLVLEHARAVAITPGMWAIPKCLANLGNAYRGIIAARNINGMTYGPMGISNWIPIVCGGNSISPP